MTTPFKVFGIGLSRTGTTSLTRALSMLGFRCRHYPNPAKILAGDLTVADRFDALTDIPAAAVFRDLDARYPGARFVLTVREPESWTRSMRDHFAAMGPAMETGPEGEMRRRVYGDVRFDEERFLRAFEAHNAAVRAHFADRPGDLLIMNIPGGEGWGVLCPFLGVAAPMEPFPVLNRKGEHPKVQKRADPYVRTWITGPGL